MLNRPSRTQNEEIVPVGRGEREQRWTLEEESQHCIFPEVIPPRWTHVKRSEQQGSMDSQGANQRDFSIPGNQEIPVKGSWRNTQKRFTKKGCAIGCHHPRLFCRLLSPSPHCSTPRRATAASVKAMAIIRGFSQEREGKTVACKNEDVCPLRCSASSIYRLQLHFHIEV